MQVCTLADDDSKIGMYDRIEYRLVRGQSEQGTSGGTNRAPVLIAQQTGYELIQKNQGRLTSEPYMI